MNIMRWKVRKLVAVILLIIFVYFWIRPRNYNADAEVKLVNAQPNEVWEYIADFSNMINLNPTIMDFSIIKESGNYEHWQYSVKYTERLSHWPYLENYGTAHFSVHSNWRKQHYYINSTHNTCFYPGILCLYSESEFRFSHVNYTDVKPIQIGTHCQELVKYQCPPILSYFCKREVEFQRDAIMKNLAVQFKK